MTKLFVSNFIFVKKKRYAIDYSLSLFTQAFQKCNTNDVLKLTLNVLYDCYKFLNYLQV